MKKPLLVAFAAGLALVSAHPPESDDVGSGPVEARSGYPPCSRTVTDRCIQLYERGVRTTTNLARNATPPAPVDSEDEDIDVAYAGDTRRPSVSGHHPADPATHHPEARPTHHPHARPARASAAHASTMARDYPACNARMSDRCSQQRRHQPRQQMAMRVRRAGERG